MIHDVIIIGGGPAGMTAALYALRNGKSVCVIEREGFGGQITHSPRVENYPGIASMSGNEFADTLMSQIMNLGADIELENAQQVIKTDRLFNVHTEEGSAHQGRSVILATGVKHRLLGLDGEQELTGNGVSYCAVCDGDFFAGENVCVVGGGNSALQDALLLSAKCASVTVVQDLPALTAEQVLQKQAMHRDNISIQTNARVTALLQQDGQLTGIRVQSDQGAPRDIPCSGLFIAIGLVPDNAPFRNLAALTPQGYFDADERCLTGTPGVFTAGDCRNKNIRQLTTAVGDGAVAALAACRYVDAVMADHPDGC